MMPGGAGVSPGPQGGLAVSRGYGEGLGMRPGPQRVPWSFPSWNNPALWDTWIPAARDSSTGLVTAPGGASGGRFKCRTPSSAPRSPITSNPGCQPHIPPSSSLPLDNVSIFPAAVASRCRTKPHFGQAPAEQKLLAGTRHRSMTGTCSAQKRLRARQGEGTARVGLQLTLHQ